MLKRALTAAALALAALSSNAQTVLLSENFDDFGSLAGKGWGAQNVSPFQDSSSTSWFQGDASIFGAYSGSGESYIAANYNAATAGPILDFLYTPTFSLANAGTVSFFAKSANDPGFIDKLAFGIVTSNGIPLDLGLLVTHVISGEWTEYSWSFNALGAGAVGRFAIEYTGLASKADYVGIDNLTVTAVPEPSTYAMLAIGLLAVGYTARRRAATTKR